VNIEVYLKENFPLKRKDIETTLYYLEGIRKEDIAYRIGQSQPLLTQAMESIEKFSEMELPQLYPMKNLIIIYLEQLLFAGINILTAGITLELPEILNKLPDDEKLKYLIESKFRYKQGEGSFPTRLIDFAVQLFESEIEKHKEIADSKDRNLVNNEVKKMVEQYLHLIEHNVKSNDFISPLIERDFDKFIDRLTKLILAPSYHDIPETSKEQQFHMYLFTVLQSKVVAYNVSSNGESGLGRFDIIMKPIFISNPGVIIEIKKIDKTSDMDSELDGALDQIERKQYNYDMNVNGIKTILNIAIVFNRKEPNIKYIVKNY
jgi:hypothetical protein